MSLLEFTQSEVTKFQQIDDEHKAIVEFANKLFRKYSKQKYDEFNELLKVFISSGTKHFHTEEKYMLNNSYPNFYSHKIEHDRFTRKLIEYQEKLMDDPAVNGNVILNFIKDWFINHVAGKDKMLGEYLLKLTRENKIIGV